jgi:hypothetical protein
MVHYSVVMFMHVHGACYLNWFVHLDAGRQRVAAFSLMSSMPDSVKGPAVVVSYCTS